MTHYSRAEIGLRPARGRYRLDRDDVEGIALHWPGMKTPLRTVPAVKRALVAWQRYHMLTRGWSDIAYQIAIDQAGNSYGLRGIRYRSAANGDEDVNRTHGAFLLVLAEGEEPTPAMIRAVRARVAQFARVFPDPDVVGHQDVRPEPTACPGPIVQRLIDAGTFEHPTLEKSKA